MIKHYTIALNLEIIATCIDDVKAIDRSEANCIELCEGMELDGITPEKGLIEAAVKLTDKPIRVMEIGRAHV